MNNNDSLVYAIFRIADYGMIRRSVSDWVNDITDRGTLIAYLVSSLALAVVSLAAAWVFDFSPTARFGESFGDWVIASGAMPEWVSGEMIAALVVLISITPSILEFTSTGLAMNGSISVGLAVNMAVAFDAITDAGTAISFSRLLVEYFISGIPFLNTPFFHAVILIAITPFVAIFATIGAETMFLSFITAVWLIPRRMYQLRNVVTPEETEYATDWQNQEYGQSPEPVENGAI